MPINVAVKSVVINKSSATAKLNGGAPINVGDQTTIDPMTIATITSGGRVLNPITSAIHNVNTGTITLIDGHLFGRLGVWWGPDGTSGQPGVTEWFN
ncbi:uncharacterized protein E0L32_002926 [Thyridium curvatum]|uniref:Uncharacterized protein n=1 Tax=Thyridium curvatum TaxID=1093900 RepID=A0A507B3Y6_9PEZI|nr:uncharacterized protein E0L32_002926 [Thyridium curvatum]TPX17825.1 hypothetical protein E0L32_002926 [Thyridium curvatum]